MSLTQGRGVTKEALSTSLSAVTNAPASVLLVEEMRGFEWVGRLSRGGGGKFAGYHEQGQRDKIKPC